MKRQLFALCLAVTGFSLPVHATPEVHRLIETIEATGTAIVKNDPRFCSDKNILGFYSYRKDVIDQLTLCVANHKGDSVELYDTFLHEAVHVAQTCNGGPLFTAHSIANSATLSEMKAVHGMYSQHQHHKELEARVIAREQDANYVATLIKEHCKV